MVRHIILWKLREDIPASELPTVKANMKRELEGLVGRVDGLLSMQIHTEGLPTSNCDVMLESSMVDFDACKRYKDDPAHVHVADTYVRPYTDVRLCLDFEE